MIKKIKTKYRRHGPKYEQLLVPVIFASLGTYLLVSSFAASPSPKQANSALNAVPYTNTDTGIHVGLSGDWWTNRPGPAGTNSQIAGKVDYIWGAGDPHGQGTSGALGAIHLDSYMPYNLDWPVTVNPLNGSTPGEHDLTWWQQNHPDWITYQCDQKTPAWAPLNAANYSGAHFNWVPLDISNPAVQKYQIQHANSQLAAGFDGIAWDVFLFTNYNHACGVWRNNVWVPLNYNNTSTGGSPWGDSPQQINDMLTWIKNVDDAIHNSKPGSKIMINFSAEHEGGIRAYSFAIPNDSGHRRLLDVIDGVFDEPGFTIDGYGRSTDSIWESEVENYEFLNANNKAFVANAYVPKAYSQPGAQQNDEVNWILASYLIAKGSQSYTYMEGLNSTGAYNDLAAYHVPIGHPISGRFQSQGVQMRSYTGGLVVVNPSSTQSFRVNLGNIYQDMYGNRLSSTTLAPATGLVLLNIPPAPPPPSGGGAPTGNSGSPGGKTPTPAGTTSNSSSSTVANPPSASNKQAPSFHKKSSNIIVATLNTVKSKPAYFVSVLSGVLLLTAIGLYWLHHINRIAKPLVVKTPFTVSQSTEEPPINPVLPLVNSSIPIPGTVIRPKDDSKREI